MQGLTAKGIRHSVYLHGVYSYHCLKSTTQPFAEQDATDTASARRIRGVPTYKRPFQIVRHHGMCNAQHSQRISADLRVLDQLRAD